MDKRALVTGAAGFIGFHLCRRLLKDGWQVVGLDGMTGYYDPELKESRLAILQGNSAFRFERRMLEDGLENLFAAERPALVVHLAAQVGVRYSIEAPRSYVQANLIGTHEVLEAARTYAPNHLMMASTSSVYGANSILPYAEGDRTCHPLSFYAATKVANEAMAHSYSHLFNLPTTMFRFFTVYGPWGRPDMALFKFTNAILRGEPIEIYNQGEMRRDFTYVDDLVTGITRLIPCIPGTGRVVGDDSLSPVAPWRIVNIGNGAPVSLMAFVAAIEDATGRTTEKRFLPMQPGDVPETWADVGLIERLTGSPLPRTDIREGVKNFVEWFRSWNARN